MLAEHDLAAAETDPRYTACGDVTAVTSPGVLGLSSVGVLRDI